MINTTHDIDDLLSTGAPIHTINEHHDLAGGHNIITYKTSTCKHQRASQAGSSRSICAVTALNCIRLAFQLEAEKGVDETVLRSFFSEEMTNQIMDIANDPFFDNLLEIDDLLEVPIFKETIIAAGKEQGQIFKNLFLRLFPPDSLKPILAVVFTQTPEHFVCFRFRSSTSYIFVIFDAHSRSEHPSGPAFILAKDVDAIATHFNRILTTQPSSSSDFKQQDDDDDVATNHSLTALVIESRGCPSIAPRVAILLDNVDRTPSNLDLDSPPDFGFEQIRRVREMQALHAPSHALSHAPPHKQQDNRQTSHHNKPPARRSEFGWQLNLQVSSTSTTSSSSTTVDPKPLEIKKTVDFPKTSDSDLLLLIPDPGPDCGVSNTDHHPTIPDNNTTPPHWHSHSHSHSRNNHHHHRTEFGWQLALQQTLITDSTRRKLEDLEIVESTTVVSQSSEIQTQHRVVVGGGGKEKEEGDVSSDNNEFFSSSSTQTLKGSISGWEDILIKQLQEEEDLVASSAGYLSQDSAWILSLRKRLVAEEDRVNNAAVASSSSTTTTTPNPYTTQLGREEITSTFLHGFDFETFSSTSEGGGGGGGESSSSLLHRRHSRHAQLFPSPYLEALQQSSSNNRGGGGGGFATLEIPASEFQAETLECGVCNELFGVIQSIQLPTCRHSFCRECICTFTKTRISEGRYPIFCPVCAIERSRVNNSHITQEVVDKLDLSKQDLEKLYSLQLIAHSVILHCPRCKQTMNVDREEYGNQRIIICPLPACRHSWCKECLKPLASSQTEHNCKQHGFERLMKKKGWKYCPGCKTPVQKETGCNHMTCGSPGCNVHFCYKCGISIIDTSNGGDVGSAVTEHYIDCVMFEKRRRCIIQ